jgi:hypothetical protein
MTVTIAPLNDVSMLRYICANMRLDDVSEIFATRPDNDRESFAEEAAQAGPMHFIACVDGWPTTSFGASLMWPGVAIVWAFSTPDWGRALLPVTRFTIRDIIPALRAQKVHRAECKALASRSDAAGVARWLTLLGMRHEGRLAGFGRQRQDFDLFAWTDLHVGDSPPKNHPRHRHPATQGRRTGVAVANGNEVFSGSDLLFQPDLFADQGDGVPKSRL